MNNFVKKIFIFLATCMTIAACQAQDSYQATLDKEIPFMRDLAADLKLAAAQKKPLLIFFSQTDCSYCHNVRSQHLKHIAKQTNPPVLLREVMQGSPQSVGVESANAFARRMDVRFFPTVVIYDGALKPLAEPLRGSDTSGFYGSYLDSAIDAAVAALK